MENDKEMQVYELGYLLLPSIAEGEVSSVVESLKKMVAEAGGRELDSEEPFLTDLAYTMTKVVGVSRYVVNEAYIGWFKFEALPSSVPALNEAVSKRDEVLRAMIIKAQRETTFTFAKARQALLEAEAAKEAAEAPAEANSEAKEPVVE